MWQYFRKRSLAAQIIAISSICVLLMALAALFVTARLGINGERQAVFRLELIALLSMTALLSIALIMIAVRHLLLAPLENLNHHLGLIIEGNLDHQENQVMPSRDLAAVQSTFDRMVKKLRTARDHYEDAQQVLATRTSTVDRLLDFSQTIQGAGSADQVFESLAHYIRTELSLAGIIILSSEAANSPALSVRATWPQKLVKNCNQLCDMESAACPCLRQNLPKSFRSDGSPVRCAIDANLSLGPEHPAHCIPFNVGPHMQVVVHMLLPADKHWGDNHKSLAQTYVNTAVSTLISLHLLAQAERQSMTDALTGLFNRGSMEPLLQREVALSERHSHPLAIVMIDMDKFKQINDQYGHAVGDHILRSFADCVRITLRKTDLAFRYGGDEFLIALPQTSMTQAVQVVQKLRQAFAAVDFSHAIARLDHQPTLSIGVAERSVGLNVLTLENLMSAADQALYDAKASDRNCVKMYTPPQAA